MTKYRNSPASSLPTTRAAGRKAEETLEAALLEGLNGPESALTPEDWTAIRTEALARLAARQRPRRG